MSQHIFIMGAPRSGTTMFYNILRTGDNVTALPYESTAIRKYLYPLYREWRKERNYFEQKRWEQGMGALYNENEFKKLLLKFHLLLYKTPILEILIEKHPANSNYIDFIKFLYPEAKIIFLFRDPVQVVLSQVRTKREVGFGKSSIYEAVKIWNQAAKNYLKAKTKYENIYLYFYEDLIGTPSLFEEIATNLNIREINVAEKLKERVSFPSDKRREPSNTLKEYIGFKTRKNCLILNNYESKGNIRFRTILGILFYTTEYYIQRIIKKLQR